MRCTSTRSGAVRQVLILAATLGALCYNPRVAISGVVRISQIYLGGGSDADSNSPYSADYVELLNATGSPVDIGGWLIAFGGTNGTNTFGCAGCTGAIPAHTIIQPCQYLLIQLGASSFSGGAPLPSPDVALSTPGLPTGAGGTLALLNGGTPSGSCVVGPTLEDLVGWGSTTGCPGAKAGNPGGTQALLRLLGGMSATGDNSADFTLAEASPRNSATPPSPLCLKSPAVNLTWGRMRAIYR